jgi:tRNA A-37 threonylcarbamoyl transferase component Bud32
MSGVKIRVVVDPEHPENCYRISNDFRSRHGITTKKILLHGRSNRRNCVHIFDSIDEATLFRFMRFTQKKKNTLEESRLLEQQQHATARRFQQQKNARLRRRQLIDERRQRAVHHRNRLNLFIAYHQLSKQGPCSIPAEQLNLLFHAIQGPHIPPPTHATPQVCRQLLISLGLESYKVTGFLGSGVSGIILNVKKGGHDYIAKIMRTSSDPVIDEMWYTVPYKAALKEFFIQSVLQERSLLFHVPSVQFIKKMQQYEEIVTLCMEKVPATIILHEYLAKSKITRARAISIIQKLARHVRNLHDHGVVHGDLHDGNILVSVQSTTDQREMWKFDSYSLIDFGRSVLSNQQSKFLDPDKFTYLFQVGKLYDIIFLIQSLVMSLKMRLGVHFAKHPEHIRTSDIAFSFATEYFRTTLTTNHQLGLQLNRLRVYKDNTVRPPTEINFTKTCTHSFYFYLKDHLFSLLDSGERNLDVVI